MDGAWLPARRKGPGGRGRPGARRPTRPTQAWARRPSAPIATSPSTSQRSPPRRSLRWRLPGIACWPWSWAHDAEPIHAADLTGAVCLAVGHEDRGLTAAVLEAADRTVFIPQLGKVGSLNVATAASIAVYEARRQGWPPA